MAVTHIDTIIHILNELTAFINIYHYSQRNTSDRDNETRNDRKYRQEQMEREQREREQMEKMERERMERMEELEKSEKLRKSRWGAQMKAELFRVNKLNMAEKKRRENAEKRIGKEREKAGREREKVVLYWNIIRVLGKPIFSVKFL